ncbi:RNA-directed DNA polymerase (Reverse transcriptase), partial [Trifolium medium]|nr:RNA-directed DNA polymerase (Reverse transcriptase) [Trifolium medium]
MEKLALLIQDKINAGQWQPIQITNHGPAISHLFFADDCLLFTKAKSSQ